MSYYAQIVFQGVFSLRKSVSAAIALSFMTIGLAACNNNNGALDDRNRNGAAPIGYYSADRDRNFDYVDNDGPITEMFDGGMDDNDMLRDANDRNRDRSLTVNDRRNNGFQRSDVNYHNHLRDVGSNNAQLAERISDQVSRLKNVQDVDTLVTNDRVVVAINTTDRNEQNVKNRAKRVVSRLAGNKSIHIVTDEETFTRVRNINNNLNNGTDVGEDIQRLFNDIGEAVTEPFDGNNR